MTFDAPLVIVYTDDPDRGGVAQYNHSLLMALASSGYRVMCAQVRSEGPLIAIQQAAGVTHHWLPRTGTEDNFRQSLTDMATPKALFESARPALVIFSDCCPMSNLAARHTAMGLRIPFVIVIGFVAEYLAETLGRFRDIVARHFARAREVIAVSAENLQLLHSHFGLAADRGMVIHYGRPPEFFSSRDPALNLRLRAELGIPAHTVVALTAARLTPVKGYLLQLAAIEVLDRFGAAANNHFVWLGEGEERPILEREIAQRHWEKRITLLGHRWNMAEWYDVADMFVLPSGAEGMPLSIMEAMAKGLPVIASAISGIPEELGPTGKLLPNPNTQPTELVRELAQTIKLWTGNAKLRQRAGAACRERAEQLFREEIMAQKTLAVVAKSLPVAV
jgi:glycosyltransferase involved in cell wall biosynthesis